MNFLFLFFIILMEVGVQFPSGVKRLAHDDPLILGRGLYGINNQMISRQHTKIIFSNTTETVIVKAISAHNPTFVWKYGEKEPITLLPGEKEEVSNNDRISLLQKEFFLTILVKKKQDQGIRRSVEGDTLQASDTFIDHSTSSRKRKKLNTTPSFEKEKPPLKRQGIIYFVIF